MWTVRGFTVFFATENMIYKGLDDEEASFLTDVAKRQAEHENEIIRRERDEVREYRVSRLCSHVTISVQSCDYPFTVT